MLVHGLGIAGVGQRPARVDTVVVVLFRSKDWWWEKVYFFLLDWELQHESCHWVTKQ